jgi:hypothetical protein
MLALTELQALRSPIQGEVKALEWGESSYGTPEVVTVAGVYRINESMAGGWSVVAGSRVLHSHDGRVNFPTVETAKAAAQADFNARILSCLAALEPIAEAVAQPFLWAIRDVRDGNPHFDECCVSADPSDLEFQIEGDESLEVIPLYASQLSPKPEAVSDATHRHVRRGTEYTLLGIGKMQTQDWYEQGHDIMNRLVYETADMAEVAIYRSVKDGSLWVRPKDEFEDGRFAALSTVEGE